MTDVPPFLPPPPSMYVSPVFKILGFRTGSMYELLCVAKTYELRKQNGRNAEKLKG